MTASILRGVALTLALALLTAPAMAQTSTTEAPKSITTLGCYSHPDPLESQGDYTFQTSGYCQTVCVNMSMPVMAITGGSTCYCGDELPSLDSEVSEDKCNSPCNGFDQQTCGGLFYWQVYLTGLTADVHTAPNSSSAAGTATSGGAQSSTTQPSVVTKAGETVVVTASASASASTSTSAHSSGSSGGSSKVGIAVGVVVGVIAIAAIIGGALLWRRHKRNREIEEEHRQNAVKSLVGSHKSDKSSSDQRLDPSIYSHRRESIGSIADERDFSRRILQVRNPDRDSKSSNVA